MVMSMNFEANFSEFKEVDDCPRLGEDGGLKIMISSLIICKTGKTDNFRERGTI